MVSRREALLDKMHLPSAEEFESASPNGERLIRGFLLAGFAAVLVIEIWLLWQVWQLWS